MAGLPREIIKWMQGLDLTWQVKIPKWDLANGYLVAEIFSWYYPTQVRLRMFFQGTSYHLKELNWFALQKFFKREKIDIPNDLIQGTIHCWDGAANMLIQCVYEKLTNRIVRHKKNPSREVDFTDQPYQLKLPAHCRTTTSKTIKNNIKQTECNLDGMTAYIRGKAHRLIDQHNENRRMFRKQDPDRYHIVPTLGERAVRKEPPAITLSRDTTMGNSQPEQWKKQEAVSENDNRTRAVSVHFREIEVKQADKGHLNPHKAPLVVS